MSAPTAREHFQVLEDTLLARFLPALQKRPKRRVIHSPKFYLFDVGIANTLLKRGVIAQGGEMFGRAFEHFIYQEILAHRHYSGLEYPFAYWRTTSGYEVDFVLGEGAVAVEVKGVGEVMSQHSKGSKAFHEEYKPKHSIIVSLDRKKRFMGNIIVYPWQEFLDDLWGGAVIA